MGLFLLSIFSLYLSLVIWFHVLACLVTVDTVYALNGEAWMSEADLIRRGVCFFPEGRESTGTLPCPHGQSGRLGLHFVFYDD